MLRRIALLIALLAVALGGVMPSQAAVKKKPDIKGAYDVKLMPDPTQDVTGAVKKGCSGLTGKGTDSHPFTVPAKGSLTVHLVSPDPTKKGATDWALWIMDKDGVEIDNSDGTGSDEQTTTPFAKKQSIVIQVCNIAGQQQGHVTFVFKYA